MKHIEKNIFKIQFVCKMYSSLSPKSNNKAFFRYNAASTYYGTVEIRELQRDSDTFIITAEYDLGVKSATFQSNDFKNY